MVVARYRPSVDYTSATAGDDDGHPVFTPNVAVTSNALPTGGATSANQTTQITAEQAIQATAGATTGAAVVTDANGTIQQYLRGIIVKMIAQLPAALGSNTPAASLSVVNAGFSFSNITTATTTTVKSGAGVLHSITINALGTVASSTIVYNNTAGSGATIATINTLAGQESYIYDVAFSIGLTLVTTGTVAPDITVSYR